MIINGDTLAHLGTQHIAEGHRAIEQRRIHVIGRQAAVAPRLQALGRCNRNPRRSWSRAQPSFPVRYADSDYSQNATTIIIIDE